MSTLHGDVCRILMYSHDTYGLGHLTRTLRIAHAIQSRFPNTTVLVLSGSPVAPYVPLPPGTDLVKMPSVLKSGADEYSSRDLRLDFKRLRAMRMEVILGTASTFRPHLFLVDNVPAGMKGEILPTLEYLRKSSRSTRIILNLRDILDSKETTLTSWVKGGVPQILDRFYDHVFVLGDRSVYDAPSEYALPDDRTRVVGYCSPGPRTAPLATQVPNERPSTPRDVLLTTGGGGDGLATLTAGLRAVGRARARMGATEWRVSAVTGPLMDEDSARRVAHEAELVGAEVHEFVPDLPLRMARADLVVAMAGYNTCCEILSHAHRAILHPRTMPRMEQWLRATAFERLGLAVSTPPIPGDVDELAGQVERLLREPAQLDTAQLPMIEGQHRLAQELAEIDPRLATEAPRKGEAFVRQTMRDLGSPLQSGRLSPASTLLSLAAASVTWPQSFQSHGLAP